MRCPSCDADVTDPHPSLCPECGRRLGSGETSNTEQLPRPVESTTEIPRPGRPAASLLRSLTAAGWVDAGAAAVLGFLAMLCVGAVFLVAAKLQFADLGSDADPLEILTAIVLLALAMLGATIEIGGLELDVIPLGGLLAVGFALSWAARAGVRRSGPTSILGAVLDGARVGPPLGLICLVAALVFRFRSGSNPAAADPGLACVLGTLWGSFFGALGGARAFEPFGATWGRVAQRLRERSQTAYEGAIAAGVMLVVSSALAAAAGLLWIITSLAGGTPLRSFDAGDAVAALVYIAGFGVNVMALIMSFALGAPLEFGEQVTIGGRAVGNIRSLSLFGDANPPWYAYLLLLIPVAAVLAAVLNTRRRGLEGSTALWTLGVGAMSYAFALAALSWMSEARLGAGLVRDRGFGRLATDPPLVLLLALVWSVVLGAVGWKLWGPSAPRREDA